MAKVNIFQKYVKLQSTDHKVKPIETQKKGLIT